MGRYEQTMQLDTNLNFSLVAFGLDEAGEMYVVGQNGTVQRIIGTAIRPEESVEKRIESREKR